MDEIEKLKGPLNPKLMKLITRYLSGDRFNFLDYYEESKDFINSYKLLEKFIMEDISLENFNQLITSLNIKESTNNIKSALNDYESFKNIAELFDFLSETYISKKYQKNTFLILKLISNHWLYKNGYSLYTIYLSFEKNLIKLKDSSNDFFIVRKLFVDYYKDSHLRNTVRKVRSTKVIKNEIIFLKDKLLFLYGVVRVKLFGSYAKGTQTKFSDLDLFVETNELLTNAKVEAINSFLSAYLKVKVNIVSELNFIHYDLLEVY